MLRDIRTNYQKFELTEETVDKNPIRQLNLWMKDAIASQKADPTAMIISTTDLSGNPDSRVVLLKEITPEGLVFFTNYNSKKGQQIESNPNICALFFWPELERQVRISGKAEKIREQDSRDYFKSRPLDSQLGAWASPQSQVIENRQVLDNNYAHFKQHFENQEITKPPHWGGFIIRPEYFEFWQGRSNRLHDRLEFIQDGKSWKINRLAP